VGVPARGLLSQGVFVRDSVATDKRVVRLYPVQLLVSGAMWTPSSKDVGNLDTFRGPLFFGT